MLTIIKGNQTGPSSKCIRVLFTCSLGNRFCFWIRGLRAFPVTLNAWSFLRTIEHWPLRHICFRNVDPHQDLIAIPTNAWWKTKDPGKNSRICFLLKEFVPGQQQFWRDVSEAVLAKQLCLNASFLEIVVWGNQGHGCCGFHHLAYAGPVNRWTVKSFDTLWLGRTVGKIIEYQRMIQTMVTKIL